MAQSKYWKINSGLSDEEKTQAICQGKMINLELLNASDEKLEKEIAQALSDHDRLSEAMAGTQQLNEIESTMDAMIEKFYELNPNERLPYNAKQAATALKNIALVESCQASGVDVGEKWQKAIDLKKNQQIKYGAFGQHDTKPTKKLNKNNDDLPF